MCEWEGNNNIIHPHTLFRKLIKHLLTRIIRNWLKFIPYVMVYGVDRFRQFDVMEKILCIIGTKEIDINLKLK